MKISESTIATDKGIRSTWAEINLSRLEFNLNAIRRLVAPSKIMLVAKANAYGHGLIEVSQSLADKVDAIGVAVLEEGILLRELGITTPIIVLGGIWSEQIPQYLQYDLTLTAASVERLEQIDSVAGQMHRKARVHLKIDTGMERIGIHYYSAHRLQEAALKCTHVIVEGIFSHLANAGISEESLAHPVKAGSPEGYPRTRLQLERFHEVLRFYERHSLPMPLRHIANSAAVLQFPESYMDMVRPGILLYGVYPSSSLRHTLEVKPVLSWKSRVVYFKVVKAGHAVSYGSTWQSDHDVRVVTIPAGYGDGYFRSMSNRAHTIINGKKYPQIGIICMDQLMINIEGDSAYNGDEVILLGEAGSEKIRVEDLAEWAGTIPYEILTNINTRVPRVYIRESDH
jgi:alanine racemase